MNRINGTKLDLISHINQSVVDIITTPIGTRVMRRDYGCKIASMIDAPHNRSTQMRMCSAVVAALMKWEPRVKIGTLKVVPGERPGTAYLAMSGWYKLPGNVLRPMSLNLPVQGGQA